MEGKAGFMGPGRGMDKMKQILRNMNGDGAAMMER